MTLRPSALAAALALAGLVLAGCAPAPAPAPTDSGTPTPVETETPVAQLPVDALLSVSMRATTDTGAAVDILLVLLKPEPIGSSVAAPRAAATLDWCEGEIDQSVLELDDGFSFAQLDVTATPVAGTTAWPAELPLHLIPGEGQGPTLAPGGGVYAVERPNELNEDGFYVPHCAQDGFIDVPGTGSLYLGWGNDGTILDDWIGANYGATFDLWGEPIDPDRVTLSDCATVITDLGKSMGGSESNLTEFFSSTQCLLVGSSV